jgi:uncharacterized protein (DUF1330 family)
MKLQRQFAAVLVAGVCIGAAAAQVIHAEQTSEPPGYVIAEVEKDPSKPQDPLAMRRYAQGVPKSLVPFNGQYVVIDGKSQTLEGNAFKGFIVILRFDSVEKAREWYDSPTYRALRPLRQESTSSRLLLVKGVDER